jgi:hypothetical protein
VFSDCFGSVESLRAKVDPTASREIAAALESVYPKAATRTFIDLAPGEARARQAADFAQLITGIRVFNWSIRNGQGACVQDVMTKAVALVDARTAELEKQLTLVAEMAQFYVDTLLAIQTHTPIVLAATASEGARVVTPTATQARDWANELANRRQVYTFLASLAEEFRAHRAAAVEAAGAVANEIAILKELTQGRVQVSKEQVFPHFYALSHTWYRASEIYQAVDAASAAHLALSAFTSGALSTLPTTLARAARVAVSKAKITAVRPSVPEAAAVRLADRPELLSLDEAPELLRMALEFQGHCPVALGSPLVPAEAPAGDAAAGDPSLGGTSMGILVAGDPLAGVVRWRGKQFICSCPEAVEAFLAAPQYYTDRMYYLASSAGHWELVHLLQLLTGPQGFAEASLPLLIKKGGDPGEVANALAKADAENGGAWPSSAEAASAGGSENNSDHAAPGWRVNRRGVRMHDMAVSTPTHFVHRHVDPSYRWNEWDLRRKALQMITLQRCVTTSQQTDASHFRRDNDSQVYLPKERGTQTGISTGSNTDRTIRYIGGLRGTPELAVYRAATHRGVPVGLPAPPRAKTTFIPGPDGKPDSSKAPTGARRGAASQTAVDAGGARVGKTTLSVMSLTLGQ